MTMTTQLAVSLIASALRDFEEEFGSEAVTEMTYGIPLVDHGVVYQNRHWSVTVTPTGATTNLEVLAAEIDEVACDLEDEAGRRPLGDPVSSLRDIARRIRQTKENTT